MVQKRLILRQRLERARAYARAAWVDTRLWITGKADPELPPVRLRFVGDGDFRIIGNELASLLIEVGGLQPTDRVLDIGCGVGRVARPLTRYLLPPGTYDGFDIVASAVRWARRSIAPEHPNFQFHVVRAYNPLYNTGGPDPASLSFPFSAGHFDFTFATSVFTHLTLPAARRYLSESFRVLRPGGRLLATFFLVDDAVRDRLAHEKTALTFTPAGEGMFVHDAQCPTGAVAFERLHIMQLATDAGFSVVDARPGTWSGGGTGVSFQDVLVLEKR